jgi:hypothetical protein
LSTASVAYVKGEKKKKKKLPSSPPPPPRRRARRRRRKKTNKAECINTTDTHGKREPME